MSKSKPSTQAAYARLSVAADLRREYKAACEMVHMWGPGCAGPLVDGLAYRRERARLLRVALRAVERAK
jgi:hypothetical protein